jgi:hypothetical protein
MHQELLQMLLPEHTSTQLEQVDQQALLVVLLVTSQVYTLELLAQLSQLQTHKAHTFIQYQVTQLTQVSQQQVRTYNRTS